MSHITLLTDFGLYSASIGTAKGILLSTLAGCRITDLSHEVAPFDTAQAAYLLRRAYDSFPTGTTHLILVDIYYTQLPKLILSEHDGMYFLAPDNGILPLAFGYANENNWLCYEHSRDKSFADWLREAARTIQKLQAVPAAEIGLPQYTPQIIHNNLRQLNGNTVTCNVVYIDHFGNVVTDMDITTFQSMNANNRFTLRFMMVNEITTLSSSYTDVRQGENLCRFNRSGYLEICVNKGSAAGLFGFRANSKHNDIKITFE